MLLYHVAASFCVSEIVLLWTFCVLEPETHSTLKYFSRAERDGLSVSSSCCPLICGLQLQDFTASLLCFSPPLLLLSPPLRDEGVVLPLCVVQCCVTWHHFQTVTNWICTSSFRQIVG